MHVAGDGAEDPRAGVCVEIGAHGRGYDVHHVVRQEPDDSVRRAESVLRPVEAKSVSRALDGRGTGALVIEAHGHEAHVGAASFDEATEVECVAVARVVARLAIGQRWIFEVAVTREDDILVSRNVGVDFTQDFRPLGVVHAVSALGLGRPVVAVMVAVHSEKRNSRRGAFDLRPHTADHGAVVAGGEGLLRVRRREVARMEDCVELDLPGKRPQEPDRRAGLGQHGPPVVPVVLVRVVWVVVALDAFAGMEIAQHAEGDELALAGLRVDWIYRLILGERLVEESLLRLRKRRPGRLLGIELRHSHCDSQRRREHSGETRAEW